MENIKVDSIAEYKLYQKVVDATKKIVNIVGISSYIFGIISGYWTFWAWRESAVYGGSNNLGITIFVIITVVYATLLVIVNRGLNKYKNIE